MSVGAPDADILAAAIEILRKRNAAGTETFLFKMKAYTPVMWIGLAIRGEQIFDDMASCKYPLIPIAVRCCLIFKFAVSLYRITTPTLC